MPYAVNLLLCALDMTVPNINFTFIFGMRATKLTQNLYFGIFGSARFGAHLSLTATL